MRSLKVGYFEGSFNKMFRDGAVASNPMLR